MRDITSKWFKLIFMATLLVGSAYAAAQAQPKESIWQKIKNSAKQTGQNAAQQGTQQVQQGAQQVQQGAQQVIQQAPGAAGQGTQQSPCGSLTGGTQGSGGALNNGASGSCGPQCFNAGPFAAAVTQMTMSQQGSWHVVRMNVQFQNTTNQPLIIAYRDGSMVMVDNLGNTYQAAGGYPGAVQGMGIDRGNQTDSQFTLGPGQTGNVMFALARMRGNQSAIGSGFSYNFTIDELQAQNGAEAIPVRQYNMNFPTLTPGASSAGFAAPGVSPAGSPVTNVAGGGAGKGSAVGASSYVGGAAPASVAPGAATSRTATSARPLVNSRAVAVQPSAAYPAAKGTAPATPNARVAAQPTANTVNRAALRSNVATAAKPAAAAKPIPTTTNPKKPANQTNPANSK
jgi:hypothetical protein